ncbi:MAG: caspase family protein [Hyphomicrobiaceae bacterium]
MTDADTAAVVDTDARSQALLATRVMPRVCRVRPCSRLLAALALILLVLAGAAGPAGAEQRIALVIGNSAYSFGPLTNPRNDAALMTRTLKGLGFQVTELIDADLKTMKKAMVDFGRSLRDSDMVGLFYYAGHGVQVGGENYLIPIGADINDEREVAFEAVAVGDFMHTMQRSASRINIVIFDACRNNPFGAASRSVTRGLARVQAPTGTIIAYSTAPDQVAQDGVDGNSPYTAALADAMGTAGLAIEDVFKRTRQAVLKATSSRQQPWEESSLTGDFYFREGAPEDGAGKDAGGGGVVVEDQRLVELKAFDGVKDSTDKAELQEFLRQFPDGALAGLVKLKLAALEPAAQSGGGDAGTGVGTGAGSGEETAPLAGLDPDSPEGMFQQAELLARGGASRTRDIAAAAGLYRRAADKGHVRAMARLGTLYDRGLGLSQDPAEALKWLRRAADKGDPDGLAGLAGLYVAGRGVAKSESEAARLYRRAATLGSAAALDGLGLMMRDGVGMSADANEACAMFERAAGLDLAVAMTHLGQCYEAGRGRQRDLAAAVGWYQKAASKGDAAAMGALGQLLELGRGAQKDLDEAVRLYRAAVAEGDTRAMTSLGYLLEQGKGVAQDLAEAATLYGQAAEAGDALAATYLAAMYAEGRGVRTDGRAAEQLYEKAVEAGIPEAMHGLARLLDTGGGGVRRDPERAATLVLEAYRRGHKATRDELALKSDVWSAETRTGIEAALTKRGFLKGRADGRFDRQTLQALQKYARSQ